MSASCQQLRGFEGPNVFIEAGSYENQADLVHLTTTCAIPNQPENTKANCKTRKARPDKWCGSVYVAVGIVTKPSVIAGRQRRQRNEGKGGNQCKGGYAQTFHQFLPRRRTMKHRSSNFVPIFEAKS